MEQGGNELKALEESKTTALVSLTSLQYRKYAIHYHNSRESALSKIEDFLFSDNFLQQKHQGLSLLYTFSFLQKIRNNDSSYQLEQKQATEILKEIVKMFQLEISRILKDQNSQYHRISEENCRILKQTNRLNSYTEPYCSPQRLIKIEILGLFIQKNYQYEQCEVFPIQKLIHIKIIEDILKLPSISHIYVSNRPKWIDNYHFIDQQRKESYFQVLISIICLVLLKRKLSMKGKCLKFGEQNAISFETSRPKKRYFFRNCDQFKYKFCEIAAFNPIGVEVYKKSHIIQSQITSRIKRILQNTQEIDQRLRLRILMFQHRLTFRSLSQWINYFSSQKSILITQDYFLPKLKQYQWILNNNDSIEAAMQISIKARDILSSQNFVGESLCRIALERLNTYAVVSSIQNRLMAKVDRQPSLYIRRFNYSYEYYYRIHHKDLSDPSSPEKRKKQETIFSIVLGFIGQINVFTFKFDEQLTQYGYVEHIIAFFKTERQLCKNIVLSELDFERSGLFQHILARIIEFFVSSFNSFVKFEGSPINFFYHLLVHSYVDKCLRSTSFESKEEFSLLLSASVLRIIKIINDSAYPDDRRQSTYFEQVQGQSQEQSSSEELYQGSGRMFFENSSNFTQYCPKFDSGKIQEKVEAVFKRRQSMTAEELQSVDWRGKQSFHRKGAQCQYYFFKERNIFKRIQQKTRNSFKTPLNRDPLSLKQQVKDVSAGLLSIFRKDWPFLTSQQIQKQISDVVEFRRKKNTGMNEIKALLRGITRTLLIYQAYFNEYFLSEKAKPEIQEKYSNHLLFLRQTYRNETLNINRLYPEQIQVFYFRLLKDLALFPTTSKIINVKHASLDCQREQLQQITRLSQIEDEK